jgi:Zn-dependent peptidase ImmA (M78 family)
MAYRRGFKSEAEAIAREVRRELGLETMDRLDPLKLADHLDISVLCLTDLELAARKHVRYLRDRDSRAFSAVTVFCGYRRLIVHNDGHSPERQASNVTHELSHALLHHPPTPALDDIGCRRWDQNVEDEAQFLAGVLLLPGDACIAMVFQKATIDEVAAHFSISSHMAHYRLNISGALKIAARARRRSENRVSDQGRQ